MSEKKKELTNPLNMNVSEFLSLLEESLDNYTGKGTKQQIVFEVKNIQGSILHFMKDNAAPIAIGLATSIFVAALKRVGTNNVK